MQGRLSPPENGRHQCFPRASWRDEFERAAGAGLGAIEWIWDAYGADANPLTTDCGIEDIKVLSDRHAVSVRSVCADYFMEFPLVRTIGDELVVRRATLAWLMERCAIANIGRIVLPFLDASRMESDEDLWQVVSVLNTVLPVAEATGVALHLETSLAPEPFSKLLSEVSHPLVKVNYDSGNSASLGFRPEEEFRAYGFRVGSVHVKDRARGGRTVPLGTGDTDFSALSRVLGDTGFEGDFVLEVARGRSCDELEWSRQNRLFVESSILAGMHR